MLIFSFFGFPIVFVEIAPLKFLVMIYYLAAHATLWTTSISWRNLIGKGDGGVRFLRTQNFFWSVVTQGIFVKQGMCNRIFIDYTTNCTPRNVQTACCT